MIIANKTNEFANLVQTLPEECPFLKLLDQTLFNAIFLLEGTNFRLVLKHNMKVYWQLPVDKDSTTYYGDFERVSFEEVLESCSEELQEKMIFHLELLSNEAPARKPIGWNVQETIGMGVVNPRGITSLGIMRNE